MSISPVEMLHTVLLGIGDITREKAKGRSTLWTQGHWKKIIQMVKPWSQTLAPPDSQNTNRQVSNLQTVSVELSMRLAGQSYRRRTGTSGPHKHAPMASECMQGAQAHLQSPLLGCVREAIDRCFSHKSMFLSLSFLLLSPLKKYSKIF